MSMLDRYKKKGGFIQLLILIETSSKQKQDQFLGLIAQENPLWEEAIKKKTITLDRILNWDSTYLAEIFSRLQPLTIAVAFRNFPPEQIELVLKCFSSTDKRKIQNLISETQPSNGEISTCGMKVISEVRELMKIGVLKMDKIDSELTIPENIEDTLNSKAHTAVTIDKAISDTVSHRKSSSPEPAHTDSGSGRSEVSSMELESYKKKVSTLTNEVNHLKSENAVLKSKLEQIKKIA
jgi:hypothetical protein